MFSLNVVPNVLSEMCPSASKRVRLYLKKKKMCRFVHVVLFTPRSRLSPTSGTAAALVRGPFADAALGTLGTAHGAAGTAALLAGGALAIFAFAGAGARAGFTRGAGAVGIHGELKRRLGSGNG